MSEQVITVNVSSSARQIGKTYLILKIKEMLEKEGYTNVNVSASDLRWERFKYRANESIREPDDSVKEKLHSVTINLIDDIKDSLI